MSEARPEPTAEEGRLYSDNADSHYMALIRAHASEWNLRAASYRASHTRIARIAGCVSVFLAFTCCSLAAVGMHNLSLAYTVVLWTTYRSIYLPERKYAVKWSRLETVTLAMTQTSSRAEMDEYDLVYVNILGESY